ncbi:hypothetical protein G9A89_017092 [Geosiphon pyriformis]|nr:hypothetical protein G9A89_017092 [Geosiphon pyriformis]
MMVAIQLANDCDVVVNTDLKRPINNRTNQAIVLKEIPVGTSIEAVHTAISEFGFIKSIKIQLIGLWQKTIVKLEDQNQTDLLAAEWFILIGKDVVCVAWTNVDKQTWNARDKFKALLYTLLIGTNAHDLWNFIGSVSGKTCVIECNSVSYVQAHCATVCFNSEGSLIQTMANTPVIKDRAPLSAQNWFYLAKIYEKKSAPITRFLAFGGKTWASMVGSIHSSIFLGYDSQLGFIRNGKPLPPVVNDLEKHLVNIESSLVSLIEQIGKLAKRLKSFVRTVSQLSPGCQLPVTLPSQNQGEDIVMGVGLGDATSDKTAAVSGSTASPKIVKLENMLEGLSALVMSLSAHLDGLALKIATCNIHGLNNPAKQNNVICWHKDMNNLVSIFTESKLKGKIRPWLTGKFDSVQAFTSGLNSGFSGASVLIIMNSSLAKHVCKVSEVPSRLLSIKLLFKNKLSVSILGLYAGALLVVCFFQTGEINSLIAKAVNKSFFVILGGDFNKNSSQKCASFKKCLELELINSLIGSLAINMPTWVNSREVMKTIDYVFVSQNLVNFLVHCGVLDIGEYFNTDHQAVLVSMGLGSLLDTHLFSFHKQTNKDHWKFDVKNASKAKWLEFKDAMAANTTMFLGAFGDAVKFSDLGTMCDVIRKIMILSAGGAFKKRWFKGFDTVCSKESSRFHKLELLVSKLVKASCLSFSNNLDPAGALTVRSMFFSGAKLDNICSALAKARRLYHSSKLMKSKHVEESHIRQAITNRMESFELDKSCTIRSVLECPFCKVVLDHLVMGNELVLKPDLVKSKVDTIMEGWTRKHVMVDDISDTWFRQYQPLDYVFDDAFSGMISKIDFDELHHVINSFLDGKAAGLSGIFNELWKHCDKSVLGLLLVFLNFCLSCELVPEGVFMNTYPIVLIKTACKILSKILSDRISLACSLYDVLRDDNFSVLKGTTTQSPIFVVGSIIENALEKNQELWLVLQDMWKTYNSVGWEHLERSLVKIKMCNFGLTNGYQCQESVYGYRLNSHFVSGSGYTESQAEFSTFLAAEAFVEDTIWIGSSQVAIQHILNIASEFFRVNDISINNDKTVVIPINSRVSVLSLFISGLPISVAHKGEPHWYLASVCAGLLNFCESDKFVATCGCLFQVDVKSLSVYTDGSLKYLDTVDCRAGTAAFFEDIGLGLGVGVQGLVSFTLAELQTIALALECMPAICSVKLFLDSQAALDACRSELSLMCPDFYNQCWVEQWHIWNVIHSKNLKVSWHKVKSHSSILGNDRANGITNAASLSDVYHAVCHAQWEVGSGSEFLASSLYSNVDWFSSSGIWHPNLHMATGFISRLTADTRTYLMKTLHCQLPVAVWKRIYDKCYPSVLCLYCDEIEVSDHVFSCMVDDLAHCQVLESSIGNIVSVNIVV